MQIVDVCGIGTMRTLFLFFATALAEIVGCYLPYLWLKQGKSIWLLIPAFLSLALFCMAADTARDRSRAYVRRLRGRLCRCGDCVAMAG